MAKEFSNEALKIWMTLPAKTRRIVLGNVWCRQCMASVAMCDYHATISRGFVLLKGFCGTCRHKVARAVEGCGTNLDASYKNANVSKPEKQKKPRVLLRTFGCPLASAIDASCSPSSS